MKARVIVMPKQAVLDPQGNAVRDAIHHLGLPAASAVRVGKFMEIDIDDEAARPRPRVRERAVGTFYRQVTLVEEVDFDRVEAQAKDGVLTVRLPKRESGQARTITIQPASS